MSVDFDLPTFEVTFLTGETTTAFRFDLVAGFRTTAGVDANALAADAAASFLFLVAGAIVLTKKITCSDY